MNRPQSDFEALRQDLRNVYAGSPWHGSSITDVLNGVDADTAAQRMIPTAHTIWELVLHMTGWTREVTSRLKGAAPKSPPEDWPVPRFGGGASAWKSALDDFASAHREVEEVVAALKPEDLVRWIGDKRDPALGAGVTVGTLIRGLIQHHVYHEGQIALLKRVGAA
ncbi:MAG TPA: DinB family protein [Gemmatimonadaceae bacterium]|nr:DinB family protein [Gemmatimonadaceae bacterium]